MVNKRKIAISLDLFKDKLLDLSQEENYSVVPLIKEGSIIENKHGFFLVYRKEKHNIYTVFPIIEYPELASKEDILFIPSDRLYTISPLWFINTTNRLRLPLGELKKSSIIEVLDSGYIKKLEESIKGKKYTGILDMESQEYKKFLSYMNTLLKGYKNISKKIGHIENLWFEDQEIKVNMISLFKLTLIKSSKSIEEHFKFKNFDIFIKKNKIEIIPHKKDVGFAEVYLYGILFDILEVKDKKAILKINTESLSIDEFIDNLEVRFR